MRMTAKIEYDGNEVGAITGITPEKWHVEGVWNGNGTIAAGEFVDLISSLPESGALSDVAKETVVRCSLENGECYIAKVRSFLAGRLALMRVLACSDAKWLDEKFTPESED